VRATIGQTYFGSTAERPLTAPTQKAGFRVPKTVLWLFKRKLFKSSFVVKVPPFGLLLNVTSNPKTKSTTMKIRILISPLFILTFFGLTGCSSILTGLYGIKEIKTIDEKTIVKYAKKYKIPVVDNYELDTAYFSYLFSLDTTEYKTQIKNHYQPLQALYYDKTGHLTSFQVNCYAGGFPNLKWDRNAIMTTFPPKQQAPVDSIVQLETQMKYLKPLSQTAKLSSGSYDYIVIVYWNRFMGRQSKRLIRFIKDNSKLETEKKIKIIYANTDNIIARQ